MNTSGANIVAWLPAWSWRRTHRTAWNILAPALALFLLLALWQAYATLGHVDPQTLPAPLHIWQVTTADWPNVWPALDATLRETAIGFAWAMAFGFAAAMLLDLLPPLRLGLYPLFVASQSIPIIAIAPLFEFWFGVGLTAKVVVIVLSCFFPLTVAGLDGLRAADPDQLRLFRGFGASAWQIFWAVRLPSALPALFSGLRIAIAYSVIGAIISEATGAYQGVWVYMALRQREFRIDLMLGMTAAVALVSVSLFLLVFVVERLAIPWFYAARRPQSG